MKSMIRMMQLPHPRATISWARLWVLFILFPDSKQRPAKAVANETVHPFCDWYKSSIPEDDLLHRGHGLRQNQAIPQGGHRADRVQINHFFHCAAMGSHRTVHPLVIAAIVADGFVEGTV